MHEVLTVRLDAIPRPASPVVGRTSSLLVSNGIYCECEKTMQAGRLVINLHLLREEVGS